MEQNTFETPNLENVIIHSLLTNSVYFSKTFSYLKKEHFSKIENSEIFSKIKEYYSQYSQHPTPKEIGLSLKDIKSQELQKATIQQFKDILRSEKMSNFKFLIDKSQEFVQKQEFIKAILAGADAIQTDKELSPIYESIGNALKINFDADIGLSYDNLEARTLYYKTAEAKAIFTGIGSIDKTLGGFRDKTLNVVASVSHGGKSLFMSHCACNALFQKKNILYITLEMSEFETIKRMDANMLNLDINTFRSIPTETFISEFNKIQEHIGKLVVKEFSAGSFDVLRLESLIVELMNELNFSPDIIFIDYLTLMKSTRVGPSVGSYTFYKMIAEELHGFAKKWNLPVVTAAQLNRSGYNNKESGIESVSDSLGIAMTADLFFSIIRSKDMDKMNQVLISVQKNRNTGNMSSNIIGVEYSKMRYFDIASTDYIEPVEQYSSLSTTISEINDVLSFS